MKSLLASAVLVLSTVASATTNQLPKDSIALTLLSEGQVTVESRMPNCPKPIMCEPATMLTIKFTLPGCMDKLGPVTIKDTGFTADGKKKFVVTAYNINNEASKYTKCFRAPIGVATQVIGMGFMSNDSVEVEFTNYTVRTETL